MSGLICEGCRFNHMPRCPGYEREGYEDDAWCLNREALPPSETETVDWIVRDMDMDAFSACRRRPERRYMPRISLDKWNDLMLRLRRAEERETGKEKRALRRVEAALNALVYKIENYITDCEAADAFPYDCAPPAPPREFFSEVLENAKTVTADPYYHS